jgi:hypothetical protein
MIFAVLPIEEKGNKLGYFSPQLIVLHTKPESIWNNRETYISDYVKLICNMP